MHEHAPGPSADLRLPVRFTGSGSEYFRIWIVNVLLTIVTLGIYHPFAKARRLAYFHANTRVGDDALAFHGNPRRMLRGFLLVVLAWLVYVLAARWSPVVGGLLGLLFLMLWPALWRASLQFRLGNTSWRGLRMRFTGSVAGAYRAYLPAMLPMAGLVVWGGLAPQTEEEAAMMAAWMGLLPLAFMLLLAMLGPWWMASMMRYRQDHSAWGGEQASLHAGTGAFYAGAARLLGLVVVIVGIGVGLAVVAGIAALASPGAPKAARDIAIVGAIVVTYLVLLIVVWPYASARLQDIVWGRTASANLRFHSRLSARRLAWVGSTNLLLTLLTIGLYRPFAVVRMARLRLEAVTVHAGPALGAWSGTVPGAEDATGDFAGDFFGFDIGF